MLGTLGHEGNEEGSAQDALNTLSFSSDDPRTMSEMKRSRIDLDRRYVFLCPTSLSKCFDFLPRQAKDSALLVFKCSRSWLIQDTTNGKKLQKKKSLSKVECGLERTFKKRNPQMPMAAPSPHASHGEVSREFREWILTKEREGCIYWWKPEKDFQKLSKFFEDKVNPVNMQRYRPLLLDPYWWRVHFNRTKAKYCNNPATIAGNISERANAGLDKRDVSIPALQELIYQSNPTLEPIVKWPYAPSMRFLPKAAPSSSKDFVGQLKCFKGYIDRGTPSQFTNPALRKEEQQSIISQWPPVAKERFDDLKAAWQWDDVVSRRTGPLPGVQSAPPTVREGGGLFGPRLGFGQGSEFTQKLAAAAHANAADASLSPLGSARSLRER